MEKAKIQITCPDCKQSRYVKDHPVYASGVKRCPKCAGKIASTTPGWIQSRNKLRKTKRQQALVNKDNVKTVRGPITCPICKQERTVWHNRAIGTAVCHSCAGKNMAQRDNWRSANDKRVGARWTELAKKRQSELSRQQVLAQGGIPNAVKLTSERVSGPANYNWRGGIAPENSKSRSSKSNLEWTKSVYARDDYTCQICQKRGGKLHAHHIQSFSKFKELRYELSNGMTTCKSCHREILHRGNFLTEPMPIEEICELQRLVANGAVTLDWKEAA